MESIRNWKLQNSSNDDLIQNMELLETVLNNTTSSIMLFKPLMNREGKIIDFEYLFANTQTSKSVNKSNLIGKRLTEEFPSVKDTDWWNHYITVMETGKHYAGEMNMGIYAASGWSQVYARKIGDLLLVTYFDITLQKETEQEIQEQVLLSESIKRTVPAIIFIVELPSRKTTYINREPMELLGFSTEEINKLTQEQRLKLLDPGDAKELNNHYNRIASLSDGEETSFEYRSKNNRGEWFWFKVIGKVFKRDANGKVTQALNIATDITSDKKSEHEVRRNKELLQATMDAAMDMIQVFESVRSEQGEIVDFRYVLLNHEAEKWMPDAMGKHLLQQQPGVLEEGIFETFKQVAETGITSQKEYHYVHEQFNGWFYQSVVKLGDGVVTTTRDITVRKETELELQQSKSLLQDIINAPNIGIAVYKAKRNEKGAIVDFTHEYINKTTMQMLGEDFTGKLLSDHGESGRAQIQLFREAVETGKSNAYNWQVPFKGREAWFSLSNTPLDGERLVHTWEEITVRKQAEEEIIRLKDEVAQKATDRYYSIFNSMDEGFCIYELIYESDKAVDLRWVEVNPAYEKQTGLKAVKGKRHSDLSLATESSWFDIYDRVVKTGESIHFEDWHGPTERWYLSFASRIGGADSRQVAVVFTDITERKRREQRQDYLLQLNDLLRSTAPGMLQEIAAEALLNYLKVGWVYYIEMEADGDTISTMKGFSAGAPLYLPPGTKNSDFGKMLLPAYANGHTLFIEDIDHHPDFNETDRQSFKMVNCRAFVSVPLVKNKRLIALLGVCNPEPRRWTADEILTIDETAQRIWTAMERARAEETLREMNENLEQLVKTRTKQLSKLKLAQEKEKLNAIIFAQEQERARISEGLHDGVAQLLYAAQNRLQLVTPDEAGSKELQTTTDILVEAVQELRKVSFELMPPVLRDHGLKASLETLIYRIVGSSLQLRHNISLARRLPEKMEITLYRIVQETLNNILKHARATEASVTIMSDEQYIYLKVWDNGVGFVMKKSELLSRGIGLQSIYNRVKLLNGKIKITSSPGQGTLVKLRLPLNSLG